MHNMLNENITVPLVLLNFLQDLVRIDHGFKESWYFRHSLEHFYAPPLRQGH